MRKLGWVGVAVVLMWIMPLFAVRVEAQTVAANCATAGASKESVSRSQEAETTAAVTLKRDEIARMSPALRAQLLRLLEDGLKVWRQWVEVSAENLANSETTRTSQGDPYRRKKVVFQTVQLCKPSGASVVLVEGARVVEDPTPFDKRFQPGHPDASQDGYVSYPNVNPTREMANLVAAARGYEATVAAMNVMVKKK